jgi:hypothetical protein
LKYKDVAPTLYNNPDFMAGDYGKIFNIPPTPAAKIDTTQSLKPQLKNKEQQYSWDK